MVEWKEANLRVRPEQGGLVPFKHRPVQLRVTNFRQKCFDENRPAWSVTLKSRRHGHSTNTQGDFAYFLSHGNHMEFLTLAHCEPSALFIFDMQRTFHRELPDDIRPPLMGGKKESRGHLTLAAPWYNRSAVLTAAGAPVAGAGYNGIHASEMAFWPNASIQMEALNKCIAKRPHFSIFDIESTPNGLGEFKYYVDLAHKPDSPWQFFFFPPWDDAECRLEPAPQWKPNEDEQAYYELIERETPDLILDIQQQYWVHRTLIDLCGSRWAEFHRQFPGTEALAWASSANYVFSQHLIANRIQLITPQAKDDGTVAPPEITPLYQGDIWFDPLEPLIPKLIPPPPETDRRGPLKLYKEVQPTDQVAGGVDTGKGVMLDDSAAIFFTRTPCSLVAVYKKNDIPAHQFAMKIYLLSEYLRAGGRLPFLVIDQIGIGETTVGLFAHGFNQMGWEIPLYDKDRLFGVMKLNEDTMKMEKRIGFHTGRGDRERIILNYAEAFNAGTIEISDLDVLQQMQGLVLTPKVFVTTKGSITQKDTFEQSFKEEGAVRPKDDLIMGGAMCYTGVLFAPKQASSWPRAERGD
ncbi:MAG: hypothetical protein WC891_08730 [Actinomycetota bacterium]|jgi:hypothetical protein